MKTFCLTTLLAVFVLFHTNGIQAQPTQTKLNQFELMKQFIGNWKCEVDKDTTLIAETTCFRNGALEVNFKTLLKGQILAEQKNLMGYDEKRDKNIAAMIWSDYTGINLVAFWFTSKNICQIGVGPN